MNTRTNAWIALALMLAGSACTQAPQQFRLAQRNDVFSAVQDINTKIDMLFVVDNSASMDVSQQKLRGGFASFATKYMQPSWDIRMAVITTDTFIANSAYDGYKSATVSGSVNYLSSYILSRWATWTPPSWNPSLVNSSGRFPSGYRMLDIYPQWQDEYAILKAGPNDGPRTTMCFEGMPYFFTDLGVPRCRIRDAASANRGTERCLRPQGGEVSAEQCVNTLQNDTVHSGSAIIETKPPTGTPGDAAWVASLTDKFMLNVTTGSSGLGSERGFQSVLEVLAQNENRPSTRLFRPDSTRLIVFVSDEDDQTMNISPTPPAVLNPFANYVCDQTQLQALNTGNPNYTMSQNVGPTNGYCCSGAGCRFTPGTCPSRTLGALTFNVTLCPSSSDLRSVASVKSALDSHFAGIDTQGLSNYLVAAIVPTTAATINQIHAARLVEDDQARAIRTRSVDLPQRYIDLVNQVGNGSLALDMGAADYAPVLDAIGQAIITRKSTFTLAREVDASERLVLQIIRAAGGTQTIAESDYVVNGRNVTITNQTVVLGFQAGDQLSAQYFPNSLF